MRFPDLVSRATVATTVTIALLIAPTDPLAAQGRSQGARVAPGVPRLQGDEPLMPPEARFQEAGAPTGDYRIDALLSGTSWPLTTITYSFYSDAVFGGRYYGPEAVSEVSERVKANVRAIMAWYSSALGVSFVEVAETSSTIGLVRVMRSSGPGYAYAYYPAGTEMFSLAGDVHLSPACDRQGNTNGFQHPAGANGYLALIHEIGHAVGLKHPHTGPASLPRAEDNEAHTVMSQNVLGEPPAALMAYDLLALQHLYGTRAGRTNNDTYVATRAAADQYQVGDQLTVSPSAPTKLALWDTGGYDTIDLSAVTGDSSGYRVDLRPLGWISTGAAYRTSYFSAGLSLGPGVSIRKVVNSSSNDTIYASEDANVFAGYAATRVTGNDVIHDADGADTIDLSGYAPAQVTETASGRDLVLGFGANGSLTLKDYYAASSVPAVVYEAAMPAVSVGDVSVVEDHGGTVPATFLVELSTPTATRQSVSWATAAGTATAGTDFLAASGTLTFAPGESQKAVSVLVLGDTTVEADETFSVMLSGASEGLAIAGAQGNATIVNDDVIVNAPPGAQGRTTPVNDGVPWGVAFVSPGAPATDAKPEAPSRTRADAAASTGASPSKTDAGAGTSSPTRAANTTQGTTASQAVTKPTLTAKQPTGAEASSSAQASSSARSSDPDAHLGAPARIAGDGTSSSGTNPSRADPGVGTPPSTQAVNTTEAATASQPATDPASAEKQRPAAQPITTGAVETTLIPTGLTSDGSSDSDASSPPPESTTTDGAWAGAANPSQLEAGSEALTATPTVNPDAFTPTQPVLDEPGAAASQAVTPPVAVANDIPSTETSTTQATDETPLGAVLPNVGSSGPDGSIAAPAPTIADDTSATAANAWQPGTGAETLAPAIAMFVSSGRVRALKAQSGMYALADLTVTDANNRPVSGARVTITWSGLVRRTNTGTTDANGNVSIVSRSTSRTGTIRMKIRGVAKSGYTYEPSQNTMRSASAAVR